MSSLDRDLLYEIAEKLVYSQADEFNFDDVSNVMQFMFLDHRCMNAFLSQFSRIRTFNFGDYFQSDFQNSTVGDQIEYYGAIEKDKWLVALLIQRKKFRPKKLILNCAFGFKHQEFVDVKPRTPLECLMSLFEIREEKLDLRQYDGPHLLLDYLEVNGERDNLKNLDKILGLDAKDIELNINIKEFNCMPDCPNYSSVNPSRVEVVKLMFTSNWCDSDDGEPYKKFPTADWVNLFSDVLSSCINLKVLKVRVVISDGDDDRFPNLTCDRLLKAMKSMKDVILPIVIREGCFIEVEFDSYLSGTALEGIQVSNQELFSIGVRQPMEDNLEVCRTVSFDKRAALSFSIYRSDEGSVSNGSVANFGIGLNNDGWGFSDEEVLREDDEQESYYIGSDGDDKVIIIE
uniref:DUF38 domain-containing protein n=1 Tax=Ditylenchus dipsaci TaxID=166011 RepID=A0A915EDP2_9BILA